MARLAWSKLRMFVPSQRATKKNETRVLSPLARISTDPNCRSDQSDDSSCRRIAKIAEENVGFASGDGPWKSCLADHARLLEVLFYCALFEDENECLCGRLPHG